MNGLSYIDVTADQANTSPILPVRVFEGSLDEGVSSASSLGSVAIAAVDSGILEHVIIDKTGKVDYFVSKQIKAEKYDITYDRYAMFELVLLSGLDYGGVMRRNGHLRRSLVECDPGDIQVRDKILLINMGRGIVHQFTTSPVIATGLKKPWRNPVAVEGERD